MRSAAALFVLAVLTGCVGAPDPSVETATVGSAVTVPRWSEATRVFDVPSGDSFGVLVVNFTPEDASDFFIHGETYMLMIDRDGLGKNGYGHISAHFIDGNESRWGVANGGIGGRAGVGGTDDDGGPPRILFVVVMHTEAPAKVRLGARLDSGELPSAEIKGTWEASGPAEVSYLHAFTDPLGSTHRSYGMERNEQGLGFGGLVAAGDLALSSRHAWEGPTLEFSSSILASTSGAGVVDLGWTASGETHSASTPYAAPAMIAYHVAGGPAMGGTETTVRLRGADALSFLAFDHVSAALDLGTLGLSEEPIVSLPSVGAVRVAGACIAVLETAHCA